MPLEPDMGTNRRYEAIADWYTELIRARAARRPDIFELIGDVVSQRVCDLACGEGLIARHLAERGARVVGVDISRRLLAHARSIQQTSGITYVQDDAQGLAALRDAVFDGVTCNLALMDIADLDATAAAVYRVLRPGGWFVFSVVHPICAPEAGFVLQRDGTLA
ncbi:MAG: methyltransferase domain-containing protein [Chloroflexi bacterium]|nr:methyltransferase domain-containing protein [Chloroflexota bacterium]